MSMEAWLAYQHQIGAFPKGWGGSLVMIAVEGICAPSWPVSESEEA